MGNMVYVPLYDSVIDRIEEAVDAIATAWERTLPLPGEKEGAVKA